MSLIQCLQNNKRNIWVTIKFFWYIKKTSKNVRSNSSINKKNIKIKMRQKYSTFSNYDLLQLKIIKKCSLKYTNFRLQNALLHRHIVFCCLKLPFLQKLLRVYFSKLGVFTKKKKTKSFYFLSAWSFLQIC